MKRADNSQLLLVATERMGSMAALLGTELESVGTFTGNADTHTEQSIQCVSCHFQTFLLFLRLTT